MARDGRLPSVEFGVPVDCDALLGGREREDVRLRCDGEGEIGIGTEDCEWEEAKLWCEGGADDMMRNESSDEVEWGKGACCGCG